MAGRHVRPYLSAGDILVWTDGAPGGSLSPRRLVIKYPCQLQPVTSSSQLPGAAEGAGPPRILASAGWTVTTAADAFALGPLWSTETQFVSMKSTWYHNKSTGE